MEIRFLQEFIAIVQYGNFSVAANELYVSQSSLSKHMQALENELGMALFDRKGRSITVTEDGKEFLGI